MENKKLTRREILRTFMALPAALALAACAAEETSSVTPAAQPTSEPPTAVPPSPTPPPAATATPLPAQADPAGSTTEVDPTPAEPPTPTPQPVVLEPTPACGDDDDEPTPAQTEGPYYTPNTPERISLLEPDMTGTKMILTGYVLSTGCQPVAQALVDFWHCDNAGIYDNSGYRLRGHQFTDDQGRYTLETIMPGLYPGRTRHIHVKVQAPNQPVLTSQLYFPDEPDNDRDGIFHPALVVEMQDAADGKAAAFNFVLDVA
jgi:protocatechuate 3,4-dioxygenase beta subunit